MKLNAFLPHFLLFKQVFSILQGINIIIAASINV